jgi:hypothetical protein
MGIGRRAHRNVTSGHEGGGGAGRDDGDHIAIWANGVLENSLPTLVFPIATDAVQDLRDRRLTGDLPGQCKRSVVARWR